MTEEEWFADGALDAMTNLAFFPQGRSRRPTSPRKFRLFAVACAYRIPQSAVHKDCELVIRAAEEYADDAMKLQRLREIEEPLIVIGEQERGDASDGASASRRYHAVDACLLTASRNWAMVRLVPDKVISVAADLEAEHQRVEHLLRDIVGNPFRPVAFASEWRTSTAVALAKGIYESRDFGAMPILADALQDAGCDSDAVLSHCRDPHATHVRGCWVVDLVLDKK
jgi:hypothetical protein